MDKHNAIINPQKGKNSPILAPFAVMVSSQDDLVFICHQLKFEKNDCRDLFMSHLYHKQQTGGGFSVTGPLIGAPYAVMLLETLIAWGARKILFLGWSGAISETVKIGDIILPSSSIIDEGTSKHYQQNHYDRSSPSDAMMAEIKQALKSNHLNYHEGVVWSTDAVYRETRDEVERYQEKGVLAVEMETSALFTVARFRNVEVGAILVVSDDLSSFKWQPGFKNSNFKQGRVAACSLIKNLCQIL